MSGSVRVAFGFEDGEAVDVGPGRLRLKGRRMISNDAGGEPAGPMLNPPPSANVDKPEPMSNNLTRVRKSGMTHSPAM